MMPFYTVQKNELDWDQDIKLQLSALAGQIQETETEYSFLPRNEYQETFRWVLEANNIPFTVSQPAAG
jgi:hypothetical protein